MKNVEQALSEYTDLLTKNEKCSIKVYESQMTKEEFTEFNDLTQFADLVVSSQRQTKDLNLFKDLNKHKETIYDLPAVANFRAESGKVTREAEDTLEKLFNEEFDE